MIRKIVVPLDGSKDSERIAGCAAGLARVTGAQVQLVTVLDVDRLSLNVKHPAASTSANSGADGTLTGRTGTVAAADARRLSPLLNRTGTQASDHGSSEWLEILSRRSSEYLQREADRSYIGRVPVTTSVLYGSPAEMIVRHAREVGADLIAMATSRESAVARAVLGSVTDRVLHSSPVPVLVVRPGSGSESSGAAGTPEVVIIPLDGSGLSESAVPIALEIAESNEARVIFISVMPAPYYGPAGIDPYMGEHEPEGRLDELREYLRPFVERAGSLGLEAVAQVSLGPAAQCIIEEANRHKDAMVAMSTRGRSGLSRWVLGSVADKVVRGSGRPVLVIPPRMSGAV